MSKSCPDLEQEDWKLSLKDLASLLVQLRHKLDMIDIEAAELERLEALLDKAGIVAENDKSALQIYEQALGTSEKGYKIIHKRDIDEIYVNNYNKEWLINWNANMDLQLCLDFYAVITYISDYYSKDDSGTLGHIKQALKKAENESLKTKLSVVVSTFLTHRQIGESEAFFKILPHLHMKDSNIESIFVPTGFEKNRSKFLKQISKEEAKTCINIVSLSDQDGLFIEKPSMIDKFQRIDSSQNEYIHHLRYLQFNMKYTSCNTEPKDSDFWSDVIAENEKGWILTDELNLIVTDDFEVSKIRYSLPKFIQLNDLKPGEPKFMRRRIRRVARFHKINRTKHPHEYYFSELQLYSKFTKESELEPDDMEKCKLLFEMKSVHNHTSKIQNVKTFLMKYLDTVEEGKENAKDIVDSNIGDILDAALEQDNDDCEEAGITDHPDFIFKDPSDMIERSTEERRYKAINLYDEPTLDHVSQTLDEDQRLVLEIGVDFAKSIVKAKKTKGCQNSPPLLIVQGGAGSGKSSVIDALSQQMEKIFRSPGDNPDHPYIIKAAFTGTAAANIKGQTLHNAFSFGFGNEFFSLGDKTRDERRTELENLQIVIVDEYSMMKSDMLYQLDLRLREVKIMPDLVFGGVSIFLFGDILQLRPVRARYIMEEPLNEAFLLAFLISSLWQKFNVIILRQNHRQGADKKYADLLNRARIGEISEEDVKMLESRVRPSNHNDIPLDALVVTCTNVEVNRINEERLATVNSKEYLIKARCYTKTQNQVKPKTDASGAISGTPLQKELKLKVGAKVMMTYNIDTCDCLTNGAFGEVVGFRYDDNEGIKQVYVNFLDEDCGKQRRKSFVALQLKYPGRNVTPIDLMEFQYSLSKKGNDANATAVQFPLKLAFAATAHKVQGQTIKKPNSLVIDMRTVREAAQAYVILSRVQSLSQLFILSSVCADKIYASGKAMEELERMNSVALNLRQNNRKSIISCNIRSIKKNFQNFSKASAVKNAQVICLQETWLDPSEEYSNMVKGTGFNQHNNSVGRGKGLSLHV